MNADDREIYEIDAAMLGSLWNDDDDKNGLSLFCKILQERLDAEKIPVEVRGIFDSHNGARCNERADALVDDDLFWDVTTDPRLEQYWNEA